MSKSKMDDWQKAKKIVADANKTKRNIKYHAIENIGKGVIKHCHLPLYKLNKDRSYKLDKNGHKIPKYRKKHGKKILVTRKPVSIKDLMSYYMIIPNNVIVNGVHISVNKAVKSVMLKALYRLSQHQPYDLDQIIKNERQAIKDLASKQKDQNDNNESDDSKDENKQVAEKVAKQTDQNHTSTDSKDSNDDQQSNSNQDQDKKPNDDNGSNDNNTLNSPDPNNLGSPTTDAPDFKDM